MRAIRLLLIGGLLLSAPARAEKRAVLVGIDDFATVRDLVGCMEDVQTMERLLTEKMGFPAQNVRKITNAQATRAAIEEAIRTHLVQPSQPGDELVFFMSSHGTQLNDTSGDEDDKLDEALVTYDTDPKTLGNLFLDDDLGNLLAEAKANRTLVIIDTCHSGTITKGIGDEACHSEEADRVRKNGGRYLDLYCEAQNPAGLPAATRSLVDRKRNLEAVPMDVSNSVIMISAAQADQVAMPIMVQGTPHGVFTYYFDQGLRGAADKNADQKVSFAEIKAYIDSQITTSHPQIEQRAYVGVSSPDDEVFPTSTTAAWEAVDQGVGPFRVSLQPSASTVSAGQTLRFTVNTEKDGYLLLFERSPQGKLRVIVPNAYQETVGPIRVKAGSTVVPGDTEFWSLEVAPPAGAWEYKAIVSDQPLTADQLVSIDEGYKKAEGSAADALLGSVRTLVAVGDEGAGLAGSAPPKYSVAAARVQVQ